MPAFFSLSFPNNPMTRPLADCEEWPRHVRDAALVSRFGRIAGPARYLALLFFFVWTEFKLSHILPDRL